MGKANNAENALLQMEAGQTLVPLSAMTDSGDHITFDSTASYFSEVGGKEAAITPDGILTGGEVTPDTTNNQVNTSAISCNLAGVVTAVGSSAGDACTRATTADFFLINSITVTSAGAIAVVAGTEGAAIVETRGAAGGPPFIPVGSIEVEQVRLEGNSAALVVEADIFGVPNQHRDEALFPVWDENNIEAEVVFASALQLNHTGSIPKAVFAKVYNPIFNDISLASDFVPPENSHSVGSNQVYSNTIGSRSSSLGQGSFTAYLKDGITDPVVTQQDEILFFRFYPNKLKTAHVISQGMLGLARTFPAADSIQAACTISANQASTNKPT